MKRAINQIIQIIVGGVFLIAGLLLSGINQWIGFSCFLAGYIAVGGGVIFKAVKKIARGQIFDENFLMGIATIGAFVIGEYPEGIGVMLFYQVGDLLQGLAVEKSRKSIAGLMDIRPDYANVKRGDELIKVDPDDVRIGDVIVIKAGEKIPLDGIVIEGTSMLDTSSLTGEPVPRGVSPGSELLSGCVNLSGLLSVSVTKEYSESTVSKILDLVENAVARKAKTDNFITKFAKFYTPAVVALAALISIIPPLVIYGASFHDWVYRGLTFLVISCPCALVVSIPLSFFGGIGGASRKGILIKGSNYLEALSKIETVVFDKTGTLTKGVFNVQDVHVARYLHSAGSGGGEGSGGEGGGEGNGGEGSGGGERGNGERSGGCEGGGGECGSGERGDSYASGGGERGSGELGNSCESSGGNGEGEAGGGVSELMELVAYAENFSNHPISLSIKKAYGKVIDATKISDVEEISGHGIRALVDGKLICAGNDKLMRKMNVSYNLGNYSGAYSDTVVLVSVDGVFVGYITIADEIKEDAPKAIQSLKKAGIKKIVMLTGDAKDAAGRVAGALGITPDYVFAELLPDEKVKKLEEMLSHTASNSKLAFVGDGINDAPVLARADVGIAMGGLGSDAAIEAADVVIMTDEHSKIATGINISKKTLGIVKQNIVFSLAVKFSVLILATLGIASMWAGVVADVGVTVLAVLNATRALKIKM